MADLDYGASVGPMKRQIKSIVLKDGTGTPVTLTLTDFDGGAEATIPRRASTSYMPNGRRPTTPTVLETDDQAITMSLRFGLKSWKGATAHTPYEFMQGTTVNAIALTSVGVGSRFLFEMDVTYNSTVDGGASQTVTYAFCEATSISEEQTDSILYMNVDITDHENEPTAA